MVTKEELRKDSEDYVLDEMLILTKIGQSYMDFKNRMEKYTRDRWF